MITQDLSEFALHVRAILGFPLEAVRLLTPGASATLKTDGAGQAFAVTGIEEALALPRTQVRIFGKPEIRPGRRMAVTLSSAEDIEIARMTAKQAASKLQVEVYKDEQ